VFFLALTNLLGYLAMGNYKAIALFVLVGYLVYMFNKNMIVVLGSSLILTSIFAYGNIRIEGNTTMKDSGVDKKTADKPVVSKADNKVKIVKETGAAVTSEKPAATDSKEKTPKPNEHFTTVYNKKNNRVDYAATVEDAYGDLNEILGGDGIKNLTEDTQKLMKQQLQLAEAMKSMTPLLDQAKQLMNGFDMKNFGNIAEMAKQFKASN
jgi:hypothetical protein